MMDELRVSGFATTPLAPPQYFFYLRYCMFVPYEILSQSPIRISRSNGDLVNRQENKIIIQIIELIKFLKYSDSNNAKKYVRSVKRRDAMMHLEE